MDCDHEDGRVNESADRRITRLHEAAAALQAATDKREIYDAIIETAVETLGFDWCAVGVPVDGWFEVARASSGSPIGEGQRTIRTDEGISGRTLQNGESILIEDAAEHAEAEPASDSIKSAISVPLGDRGVFQGYSSAVGSFDGSDLEVADLLAAHATAALDRIERERELKRKNERLEEFVNFVGHDLQNPLSVADLRLELAKEECNTEHLDDLSRALDRMETLTDDLLTLARAGREIESKEPVDLATFSQTCWHTVETDDATLVCETEQTIRADRSRFRSLLENLVRNAVEHGSTGGEGSGVTVRVGALDGGFYVADDGPGVPLDEREQVFESGYSSAEDGTGFGLAIVEEIVESHGWEVAVTGSAAGGARFEITGVSPVEQAG